MSDNVVDASASVQLSTAEFNRVFNQAHYDFYHLNNISKDAVTALAPKDVGIEQFGRLPLQKQLVRYISFIDGHVMFLEIPNAPHGQVIGCIRYMIGSQIGRALLTDAEDNGGFLSGLLFFSNVDLPLTNRCQKRHDASF